MTSPADYLNANLTFPDFPFNLLYCVSTNPNINPLQDPLRYPNLCYGICPQASISGIGVRIGQYATSTLCLLLALLSPNIGDCRAAAFTAILSPFGLLVATMIAYRFNGVSLHHTVIVMILLNIQNAAFFVAVIRLRAMRDSSSKTDNHFPFGVKRFTAAFLAVLLFGMITIFYFIGRSVAFITGDLSLGLEKAFTTAQPFCNRNLTVAFGPTPWMIHPFTVQSDPTAPERSSRNAIGIFMAVYVFVGLLPLVTAVVLFCKMPKKENLSQLTQLWAGQTHLFSRGIGIVHRLKIIAFALVMLLWLGFMIINIERQRTLNNIIPGEDNWAYSQFVALAVLCLPAFNATSAVIQGIYLGSSTGKALVKGLGLNVMFGLRYKLELAEQQQGRTSEAHKPLRGSYARTSSGSGYMMYEPTEDDWKR